MSTLRILSAAAMVAAAGIALQADILVNGAGATFPYPIYAKWFDEFHRLHPKAEINYQSAGSGAGMRQLQAGVLDFAASDCPMTDDQLSKLAVKVLHFPTVVGAVVPVFNIPNIRAELNFTPEALAGIMLGTVRKWNAPEVTSVNPGIRLPDVEIVPIHRSDGSGSTFIFTDFLTKTSAAWKKSVGAGTAVRWPVGLGAKGNEGVAGMIRQTPYSFGYVELVYALQNRLAFGRVRNAAGEFVRADIRSISEASNRAAENMPGDFRISITNAPGKDSYPIASFTWLLTPARNADPAKRKIIVEFLRWMLVRGQRTAESLGYAPLPAPVAAKALRAVDRVQ